MSLILSIISIALIIIMAFVFHYQYCKLRESIIYNMQTIVTQMNDSMYTGYERDKAFNENIHTLENNMKILSDDIRFLSQKIQDKSY